jgi:hypothetical protein
MSFAARKATRFGGGDPHDQPPPGSHVHRFFSDEINHVCTRRRDYCHALPHGSPSVPPIEIGNVCMDMGVFTVVLANDGVGPLFFGGTRGGNGRIYNAGYKAACPEATP